MTEQSDVSVGDMVISNTPITTIANMSLSKKIVFMKLILCAICYGRPACSPEVGEMKTRILINKVSDGRIQLLTGDVLTVNLANNYL